MFEKFTNGYRKEFYNADMQKILKKHDINHYSMLKTSMVEQFNRTFKNEYGRFYTQWQLQMGRAAASCVKLQRAQASHHWHAIRRRNSRDRRKTLGHSVQIKIAGTRCKIQSRFSTREQVQDDF